MLRERGRHIRSFRLLLVGAGVALVAAACGGGAANRPTPSPPAPTATPAPSFQVLVGNNLYDSTTGVFQAVPMPSGAGGPVRFASAERVSYLTQGAIVSENLDGSDRHTEASAATILDYAWSANGTLAYITGAQNDRYRLSVKLPSGQIADADIGVGSGIGGFAPQQAMRFSPDGQLLLIVAPMKADPYLQIRALEASLRFAPAAGPFVSGGGAAWTTGGKLVYSSGGALQIADPATRDVRTILPGVHAWNPAASPDGRYIVYEQRDPQADQFGGYGPSRLMAFDTTTGRVLDGFRRDGGAVPRFVTSTQFWFATGSDKAPAIQRYDLSGLTETPAGISGVIWDVRTSAER